MTEEEEQRALAIECGAQVDEWIAFSDAELATYTAAVEAKMRERCAVVCEQFGASLETGERVGENFAEEIRSLK